MSRRWKCCSKRPREAKRIMDQVLAALTRSRMLLQLQRTFAARLLEGEAKGTSPEG